MGRTVLTLPVAAQHQQQAVAMIAAYLATEGFSQNVYKGAPCYKKGTGMGTAMQFIKIDQDNQHIYLSAWLRSGVGGAYIGGEMGINGAFGALPKKMLRDRVMHLQNMLQIQFGATPGAQALETDLHDGQEGALPEAQAPAAAHAAVQQPDQVQCAGAQAPDASQSPAPAQDASLTKKFCARCGTQAAPDARFCPACGRRFTI
nr:zinc ribbon domain-containing protein [Maliibacterium massiliense]